MARAEVSTEAQFASEAMSKTQVSVPNQMDRYETSALTSVCSQSRNNDKACLLREHGDVGRDLRSR
jgi:hypothetical protein